MDFGTHQRLKSSDLVHASHTRRAGALKVRVTTSSRSDVRSAVVGFFMGVLSVVLASIVSFLRFQFLEHVVEFVEACCPKLSVPCEPSHLFLQPARAEPARPHAPDLFGGDE